MAHPAEMPSTLYVPQDPRPMLDDLKQWQDVERYKQALAEKYAEYPGAVAAGVLSRLFTPYERAMRNGTSPQSMVAYTGGLMAIRTIELDRGTAAASNRVLDITDRILVGGDEVSLPELWDSMAHATSEIGAIGYSFVQPLHTIYERYEDALCSDIRHQPFLKKGFGIVMYTLQRSLEDEARFEEQCAAEEALDQQLISTDWDNELANLVDKNMDNEL